MNLSCITRSTPTIININYHLRGINYVHPSFTSKAFYNILSSTRKESVSLILTSIKGYRPSSYNISTVVAKYNAFPHIYSDTKYPVSPNRNFCTKKTASSDKEKIQKISSMDEQKKNIEQIGDAQKVVNPEEAPLTKAQKLKKAFAQYGSTAVVFHVGISLISLGVCYLTVASFDYQLIYEYLGIQENKIAQNAGTFVTAYAIHKVMAPLRISITLGAVPFVVKYLRKRGLIKK